MKHITRFAILSLAFIGCTSSGSFEVSITGLETTTYVNDKLTFNIAVTGGKVTRSNCAEMVSCFKSSQAAVSSGTRKAPRRARTPLWLEYEAPTRLLRVHRDWWWTVPRPA